MFPVGDDNTQRRTLPVVTYVLIALNVLFFLVELSGGDQFIEHWAFIPARFAPACWCSATSRRNQYRGSDAGRRACFRCELRFAG